MILGLVMVWVDGMFIIWVWKDFLEKVGLFGFLKRGEIRGV